MKKISMILLIIVATICFAKSQIYQVTQDNVYLNFENVEVDELEFVTGNGVEAEGENFQIKLENDMVNFVAVTETEIELSLPLGVTYHLQTEDGNCYFNDDMIIIKGEDGELIRIVEGEIHIVDSEEGSTVKINQEGISVWNEEDDEFVKISSEGIFVQEEGKGEEKNGFMLKLVGGIINSVTDFALDELKKNRTQIIKEIINREFK